MFIERGSVTEKCNTELGLILKLSSVLVLIFFCLNFYNYFGRKKVVDLVREKNETIQMVPKQI